MILVELIVLMGILGTVCPKSVEKTIKLNEFDSLSRSYFLTKFDFGEGKGQVYCQLKPINVDRQKQFPKGLTIGLIPDEKYLEFKSIKTCKDREIYFKTKHLCVLDDYNYFRKHIEVIQPEGEQIWYIYLFNCIAEQSQFQGRGESINIKLRLKNNGSHFAQNQNIFIPYLLILAIWIFIIVKYGISIVRNFSQDKPDITRIIIYVDVFLLGISYFYKVLHLIVYAQDGQGLHFLIIFHIVLKNIAEGIIITIIVSIAWGWSIIHLNHDQTYILAGTLSALINTTCLVLDRFIEQMQDQHHQYESTVGFIMVVLRLLLYGVFLFGILRSIASSAGKKKFFLKRFGLIGSVYILIWPMTVILSELFLPNYMHHQVITFTEESIHLIAILFLCHMITYPDSSYRRISMKQEDNPLDYSKKR